MAYARVENRKNDEIVKRIGEISVYGSGKRWGKPKKKMARGD